MTYPYNDEKMTYDNLSHRYTLTPQAVVESLGIDLSATGELAINPNEDNTKVVERALKAVSKHLYGYITANVPDAQFVLYMLATGNGDDIMAFEAREKIYSALVTETDYAIRNGSFWQYAGVNIAKGSAMNLNNLRGRVTISADTENELYSPFYNGFIILYQGRYNHGKLPAIGW